MNSPLTNSMIANDHAKWAVVWVPEELWHSFMATPQGEMPKNYALVSTILLISFSKVILSTYHGLLV